MCMTPTYTPTAASELLKVRSTSASPSARPACSSKSRPWGSISAASFCDSLHPQPFRMPADFATGTVYFTPFTVHVFLAALNPPRLKRTPNVDLVKVTG